MTFGCFGYFGCFSCFGCFVFAMSEFDLVLLNRSSHQAEKEWRIKVMAVFFFIDHEKIFKFHAQPPTGYKLDINWI